MIDRTTLESMLKGLGVPMDRVLRATALLVGDDPALATSGGLLNVRQAQAYLGGVSRWTIHRAVKANELPPTRLGKRIMFAKADLDAFIQTHRTRAPRRRPPTPPRATPA